MDTQNLEDRADRRLRRGIWAAALIALMLPVWWHVVDTAWGALLMRAAAAAFSDIRSDSMVPLARDS